MQGDKTEFREALSDESGRRWFINVLRGVAVFLVIYSHCILRFKPFDGYEIFNSKVEQFVCSFNMPLFMLISGYLFYGSCQKRDLFELLKHRISTLAWVIVTFSIISYYLYNMPANLIKSHEYVSIVTLILADDWLVNLRSLWFLWSVMACSVSVAVAFKLFKGAWLPMVMSVVIGIVVCCIFPLSTLNLFMLPFFIVGFLCARHEWLQCGIFKAILMSSVIVFPLMLHFYDRNSFIYTTGMFSQEHGVLKSLGIDCFRWGIGLFGSAFALCVLGLLSSFCKCRPKVFRLFELLGIYSLQVYVIQTIVVEKYLPVVSGRLHSILGSGGMIDLRLYHFLIIPAMTLLYSVAILLVIKLGEAWGVNRYVFGTFLRENKK